MAQASEDETSDFDIQLDDLSPEQLAAMSVFAAMLTGGLFSVIGLQLDLSWQQAAIGIVALFLLILLGTAFALMRAMVMSATKDDGNPLTALTNPIFVVLFLLISSGVCVFVGIYTAF